MNGRLFGLVGLLLVAACAGTAAEDMEAGGSAITGSVAAGTVVTTTTALRIRRGPSADSEKNILGILPVGTKVKIVDPDPVSGFYSVEVQDSTLVAKLKTSKGWCFGEHLLGKAADEGADEAPGTNDDDDADVPVPTPAPRTMKAQFVSKNCRPMKDDQGAFMKPTIDDYVINAGGNVDFAVMEVNSNALPYGTMLTIDELDAKPAIANKGRGVKFKIVKTAATAVSAPLTVTLCTTASGFLPPAGTELTLRVNP